MRFHSRTVLLAGVSAASFMTLRYPLSLIALIVSALAATTSACGGGDEEKDPATATATVANTETSQPTATETATIVSATTPSPTGETERSPCPDSISVLGRINLIRQNEGGTCQN